MSVIETLLWKKGNISEERKKMHVCNSKTANHIQEINGKSVNGVGFLCGTYVAL
jgi:hypothetical protein